MRSNSKKNTVVETAFRLFKQNGFFATGVDLIMRESGVSKRTLYKYFPTKNELIVAVLEYYRETYQSHLDDLLNSETEPARNKIRALFDDAATWFGDVNFHGCLAVNAMGEFSGKETAIESACLRFKQWEMSVLTGLCREISNNQPEELAYKLFVLLEGMSAIAQVNQGQCPVDMTAMADVIIDDHLR
jgi:AcrR family transcriptional regulator